MTTPPQPPPSSPRRRNTRASVVAALIGLLASAALYYGWTVSRAGDADASTPATAVTAPGTPGMAAQSVAVVQDGALMLDARLGNAYLMSNQTSEVYVSVKVEGRDLETSAKAPAQIALVIDRSGSMRGEFLKQAKEAAVKIVEQLREGDQVSVIAYDGMALTVVPNTLLDGEVHHDIIARIRALDTGGSTCIACGLEFAEQALLSGQVDGASRRVILLSDGKPDGGDGALVHLQRIATRLESAGVITSTVGIGLGYNENIMGRVAASGNGNHYFAEDPTMLVGMLEAELSELRALVARQTFVSFALADGVRFKSVFDRAFEAEGNNIRVSLGDIPAGAERNILMKLEVDATEPAARAITQVSLRYEDAVGERMRQASRDLSAKITADLSHVEQGGDANVMARVEQFEINETILRVNEQLERGDVQSAQTLVREQKQRSSTRNMRYKNLKLSQRLETMENMEEELDSPDAYSAPKRKRMMKQNIVGNHGIAR